MHTNSFRDCEFAPVAVVTAVSPIEGRAFNSTCPQTEIKDPASSGVMCRQQVEFPTVVHFLYLLLQINNYPNSSQWWIGTEPIPGIEPASHLEEGVRKQYALTRVTTGLRQV